MPRHLLRALLLACAALGIGALAVHAQAPEGELSIGDLGQSVLVGVDNDVALAAGETANAVIIVKGSALVEGTTRAIVAVDADVTIEGSGADVDNVFTVGGTLTVGPGASVEDISFIDTVIEVSPQASVTGETRDLEKDLTGAVGWIVAAMAVFLLAIWIGLGISTLVSALMMVAFGTSQARRAAWLIGHHPFKVLGAGLLAAILPWIFFALLAVTVVGLPLAIGLALAWGVLVALGYLVAGLWIGERLMSSSRNKARPYAATFLGVLILLLLSWIPLVTAIATWFGLGAVTMAGWRVLRGRRLAAAPPAWGSPYGQPYPPYGAPGQYAPPPYAPAPEPWPAQDRWPPQPPQGPPASWPG